jgi:glyoxylase-like metal-dependent hydrolase (beta-lactamase superfamily II)/ferredoxin
LSIKETLMANRAKQVAENQPGEFFVDTTCIDCDTCRQLAPSVFGDVGQYSFVKHQPVSTDERHRALLAVLCCPTGSIGCESARDVAAVRGDLPLRLEGEVYYCGYNSPKSYGGNSYLVRRAEGNWLIDSPKYLGPLAQRIDALGGIQHIFLTHSDDVADAEKYAERFGSQRIIHRDELHAQPNAERVIDGAEPQVLARGVVAIPTPGHTAGHCVLLIDYRFLFTGDHLWWLPEEQRLGASEDYCWHDWAQQIESMERLRRLAFEWVLPGHGHRVHLPHRQMQERLEQLIQNMKSRQRQPS